jgi:hypothetical protein
MFATAPVFSVFAPRPALPAACLTLQIRWHLAKRVQNSFFFNSAQILQRVFSGLCPESPKTVQDYLCKADLPMLLKK